MIDDESYSSYSDEHDDGQLSDDENEENSESLEEKNDLILDNDEVSDSEDSDTDAILKTTMVFPKKSQNINKIKPIVPIPQLKGILLPKPKQLIELPKKTVKKYSTEEIETLVQNLPGINISDNPIDYNRSDISDLLEKEAQESVKDFNMRKDITLKINRIENPKIKNYTCVVLGLMIAKKLRFGVKYDDDTENLIKDILAMLV